MPRSRAPWLGVFALAVLVAEAAPLRADMPAGPWPWSRRGGPSVDRYLHQQPSPKGGIADPIPSVAPAPEPPPNQEMWPDDRAVGPKPTRTGPFRSCGSGMGLGLAGIGAAWGMLWLGNRFARSSRSPSARG